MSDHDSYSDSFGVCASTALQLVRQSREILRSNAISSVNLSWVKVCECESLRVMKQFDSSWINFVVAFSELAASVGNSGSVCFGAAINQIIGNEIIGSLAVVCQFAQIGG